MLDELLRKLKNGSAETLVGVLAFTFSWLYFIIVWDKIILAIAFGWIFAVIVAVMAVFLWGTRYVFIGAAIFIALLMIVAVSN
jgi:hypothetical protein